MRIVYTRNALEKFLVLKEHGLIIKRRQLEKAVINPEHFDIDSNPGRIIVSKTLDKDHVLRVVYKVEDDIMRIVTFYPAENTI